MSNFKGGIDLWIDHTKPLSWAIFLEGFCLSSWRTLF